ncbi:MAG: hypothetical protein GX868_10165 [Actinobacteria bacterium]|nr:hypothetical protein [Actinomycetota bacterium]
MRPASRHPLVQQYYRELREAATALPESQRTALLSDAVGQLNRSLVNASSDADVRTVLDSFADPDQVVAASVGPVQADALDTLPSGALGLYLGIVGMVFVFLPWVGVAIGGLGLLVSLVTAFRRRAAGATSGVALGAIAVSVVAIVLPLVLVAVFDNIQEGQKNPTVNTLVVNGG